MMLDKVFARWTLFSAGGMLNTALTLGACGEVMAFEISLTRSIKADKDFVFDWWTDLLPEDSKLVKPLKSRSVVSRTPQMILIRDEEEMYSKRMIFDVKVTLKRPERWVAEYDGKEAHAKSEYSLRQEADGTTTLSYHTRVEPTGFFTSVFSPVVKPFIKRVFAGEMKTFIRALEEDFAGQKTSE